MKSFVVHLVCAGRHLCLTLTAASSCEAVLQALDAHAPSAPFSVSARPE